MLAAGGGIRIKRGISSISKLCALDGHLGVCHFHEGVIIEVKEEKAKRPKDALAASRVWVVSKV